MDPRIYREMAQYQEQHWWFHARREILSEILESLKLSDDADILEIGCGTGSNLRMLDKFGKVKGIEMDDFARDFAFKESGFPIDCGWLPYNIPVHDHQFDLVCLFDVLEHVEQDQSGLSEIRKILRPNRGKVLITVPAYPWLYSEHDRIHHHFRRYTVDTLKKVAHQSGFKVLRCGYFNSLLFPLLALIRIITKLFKSSTDEQKLPNNIINKILYSIFIQEKKFIRYCFFPFGASLVAVLSTDVKTE
ncbi:MAG: class I SAM-dependent methyltransferase [Candidatus Competibacteraceae bacterium]